MACLTTWTMITTLSLGLPNKTKPGKSIQDNGQAPMTLMDQHTLCIIPHSFSFLVVHQFSQGTHPAVTLIPRLGPREFLGLFHVNIVAFPAVDTTNKTTWTGNIWNHTPNNVSVSEVKSPTTEPAMHQEVLWWHQQPSTWLKKNCSQSLVFGAEKNSMGFCSNILRYRGEPKKNALQWSVARNTGSNTVYLPGLVP